MAMDMVDVLPGLGIAAARMATCPDTEAVHGMHGWWLVIDGTFHRRICAGGPATVLDGE